MPLESRGFPVTKGPLTFVMCPCAVILHLAQHVRRQLLTPTWCREQMSSPAGTGEDDEQMKEYKEMMRQRYLAQNPPQDQAPPSQESPATATASSTTPEAAAGTAATEGRRSSASLSLAGYLLDLLPCLCTELPLPCALVSPPAHQPPCC